MNNQFKLLAITLAIVFLNGNVSQAGVISEIFNFNDNLVPTGWVAAGGTPATIANGKMYFNGNNVGYYSKQYNFGNANKVTIEYDTYFSSSGFSSAHLVGNSTFPSQSAAYTVVNQSSSSFGLILAVAGGPNGNNRTFSSVIGALGSQVYHVSATIVKDGFSSATLTDIVTGKVLSMGNISTPGNAFYNPMSFALAGASNGVGINSIDNFKFTIETRAPKSFGLFIGVQDKAPGKMILHGDTMATTLANSFSRLGNSEVEILARNADAHENISKSDIESALQRLRDKGMSDGDNLVLYINGHGYSSVAPYNTGIGFEGISLGNGFGSGITDFDLYKILSNLDPDGKLKKEIFLDACHSGGFWGPPDTLEAGNKNLDSLKNIALFASAPEKDVMYFGSDGLGFFSRALNEFIQDGEFSNAAPAKLNFDLGIESRKLSGIFEGDDNPVFYTGGFGDAVPADSNLLKSLWFASDDFNVDESLGISVSEPSTTALMLVAFSLMGIMLRKRTE